jgi:hypothetical protein
MGCFVLCLDIWLLSATLGTNSRYLRQETYLYPGVFLGYDLLHR